MSETEFGKYEKIRRIAQGGMGEVYLARQTGMAGFDRLVILKTLKAELAKEKGFVEQFLDEARVAATLNHPNIVSIYEVGESGGVYYIAMEYIAGVDLAKLWIAAARARVGLPFHVSVRIIHDAALGLDHAHHARDMKGDSLHVVHRDISPQNIMVRGDGVAKVVDFGIAKAQNRLTQTQAGTVKGKLQYMSPEQVKGEPLDGRSDQFSLGVVLWEMCTGKRLFKAKQELDTLNKILSDPIPPPRKLVPSFPEELERVILRMLERDKGDRFETCRAAADALRPYLERSPGGSQTHVADFVREILGDELDERVKDLTPELTQARPATRDPSQPPAPRAPEIRVRIGETEALIRDEATLHQWILEGRLTRDDEFSTDGATWRRLGETPDLVPAFHEADQQRHPPDAPPQPAPAPEPAAPAPQYSMPPQPVGQSAPYTPEQLAPAPAPAPASLPPVPPSNPAHVLPTATAAWAPVPSGAPHAPPPQMGAMPAPPTADAWTGPSFGGGDFGTFVDEMSQARVLPRRSSGLGTVVLGALVTLVLLAGGAYLVAPERVEALILGAQKGPAPPPKVTLPSVVREDDAATLAAADKELSAAAARSGDGQARAAAQAALVHAALSFVKAEEARLIEAGADDDAKDKAAATAARAARDAAAAHRVEAYRLATRARSVAQGLPEAHLAMAAYQASRGALSEMRADLDAARAAAPGVAAIQREADVIEAIALASLALSEGQARVPEADKKLAALDVEGDVRLAYATVALQVEAALRNDAKDDVVKAARTAVAAFTKAHPAHARAKQLAALLPKAGASKRRRTQASSSMSYGDLVSAARRAQKGGAPHRAARLWRKAERKKGGALEPLLGLGWAYLDLGRNRSAIAQFERVLRQDPTQAEAHFGLAEARRYDGQKAAAIQAYKRYLQLAPSGPDAAVAKNAIDALQ